MGIGWGSPSPLGTGHECSLFLTFYHNTPATTPLYTFGNKYSLAHVICKGLGVFCFLSVMLCCVVEFRVFSTFFSKHPAETVGLANLKKM